MLRLLLLSFVATTHAQSTANAGLGGLLSAVVVNATLPTYSQCNTNLLSTANATGARTTSHEQISEENGLFSHANTPCARVRSY